MKTKLLFYGIGVVTLALSPVQGFSQAQAAQNRIPQQIVINGQIANGAYVTTASGQIQSFTCPSPQQYTTADGNSQGWACYEQTTGVWLLSAVPPQSPQAPAAASPPVVVPAPQPAPQMMPPQPTVIYSQPPQTVIYQPAPAVVYQPAPAVIYQPAPATVIYSQPPQTVIYQQPASTVVYEPPRRTVIIAPTYPASVIIGRAAIDAAGRVAAAAIANQRVREIYVHHDDWDRNRGWDRNHR